MIRFTRREAAAYVGLSKVTLARWAMAKKGPPFIMLGNKAVYAIADLDRYLEHGLSRD